MPRWAKIKGDENKIKIRTMAGILIVALVALSVGVAAAQYGQGSGAGGAQYVDANGDGICDNIGDCGKGHGGCGCGEQGTNFVDANGVVNVTTSASMAETMTATASRTDRTRITYHRRMEAVIDADMETAVIAEVDDFCAWDNRALFLFF